MNTNIHFVRCWVDGGVIGSNPSPTGVYWSVRIEGATERPVSIRRRCATFHTNNEAEYLALKEALLWLTDHSIKWPVLIYSDSKSVVNQFNGTNKAEHPQMILMRDECRALASKLNVQLFLAGVDERTGKRVERPREVMMRKLGH